MRHRVGFMQGRLSPPVDGRIQAFPRDCWHEEFALADDADLRIMEWTLDHEELHRNPLMTAAGRQEIRRLSGQYGVAVPSLTGDCFMQDPSGRPQASGDTSLRGLSCPCWTRATPLVPILSSCHW